MCCRVAEVKRGKRSRETSTHEILKHKKNKQVSAEVKVGCVECIGLDQKVDFPKAFGLLTDREPRLGTGFADEYSF